MKLGKKPSRPDSVAMKLAAYIPATQLPTPPKVFGHTELVTDFGMLGNDRYGDCVFAGAAHETMMWGAMAGKSISFSDSVVLKDYGKVTGFNPNDPGTDQGTDMQAAASFRRKSGIHDTKRKLHKIIAYLAIRKTDLDEHFAAAYLFGAIGIGIQFPDYAMNQFDSGEPWDYSPGGKIEGGHYVPFAGRAANGNVQVITWGRVQEMTPKFFKHYNDESIVYLTNEDLKAGVTPEGFNVDQLTADLAKLK